MPQDLANQLRIMPISFPNIPANWKLVPFGGPPPPPPNGGIVAGEIIGHRCWRVWRDRLISITVDCLWLPGAVIEGDVESYARGVHAFKQAKEAIHYSKHHDPSIIVVGTVKMWGEVVEHARGWRAQYARIRSLDRVNRSSKLLLPTLRDIYGV